MKKSTLPFLMICLLVQSATAQELTGKIPADAAMIIKYSGTSLSQKMPAEKFESYKMLKEKFFSAFKADGSTSLQNMGINLQKDAYQYLTSTDSTTSFVSLVSINNLEKFAQFVKLNTKKQVAGPSVKGYQFAALSSNAFLGWDGKLATLVVTSYNSKSAAYPPAFSTDSAGMYDAVGEMSTYSDSSIALEKVEASIDTAVITVNTPVPTEDTAVVVTEPVTEETPRQKANREAMDIFYTEEAMRKDSIQQLSAEAILVATFGAAGTSIESNASFLKLVDKNAEVSIWIDSVGLLGMLPGNLYKNQFNFDSMPGYAQAINVFFEKDRVKIEQQLFYGKSETAGSLKEVYNSKQNAAFVNYLRSTDIGYLSISVNTEAVMNFYYGFMKKAFMGIPYIGKETDLIDAYVDIMEIIIDEKAIAQMLPGNALFVLHGLTPRQVKYIAYDYDENYNAKESTKTKTEMSPDFSIVFETKNENIFNKLVNLPIKLNKEGAFNYAKTGQFYTLDLGEKSMVEKIYFMVKEGKCLITTSLADINNSGANTANGVDVLTRQSVLNSNYSGGINFKNLVAALSKDVTDKKNKKMISYLQANVNNMTFESLIENDLVKTTSFFNIAGKHNNSLEYFFNVIENLLKIEAGEKKEKAGK